MPNKRERSQRRLRKRCISTNFSAKLAPSLPLPMSSARFPPRWARWPSSLRLVDSSATRSDLMHRSLLRRTRLATARQEPLTIDAWEGFRTFVQKRKTGSVLAFERKDSHGRQHASDYFTETNSVTLAFAPAGDRESVAVFQPFAGFAIRQLQRISPPPGQLQHAAARFFRWAADRAAGEQIARLQIAAINRVMGKLLGNAPVKILKICARNDMWRVH